MLGIVYAEDLLEPVVGDIDPDGEHAEEAIVQRDRRTWLSALITSDVPGAVANPRAARAVTVEPL